jgi:hypothetical protein
VLQICAKILLKLVSGWTAQGLMRKAMMDIDIRIASKGIVETLRDRIAELEELEATGAATPDTGEELVDLHAFLDKLYKISLEHATKTAH